MRWLADECVAAVPVMRLRAQDHDVDYMAEVAPRASDTEVIRYAQNEKRLLLTEDKDFGELIFHLRRPVPGLVLLRIREEHRLKKWDRLAATIERFGEGLFGRFTVAELSRLRSRPLVREER